MVTIKSAPEMLLSRDMSSICLDELNKADSKLEAKIKVVEQTSDFISDYVFHDRHDRF